MNSVTQKKNVELKKSICFQGFHSCIGGCHGCVDLENNFNFGLESIVDLLTQMHRLVHKLRIWIVSPKKVRDCFITNDNYITGLDKLP